jgi:archaellum component FlaG (FlaF/FlaG flagellin family)
MTQIGTGYSAEIPEAGNVYLVLDVTIKNQGYDSFLVDPGNCRVVINQVTYNSAWITVGNVLSPATVLNGGQVSGKVPFEVPSSVTKVGFWPAYINAPMNTIQWIKQ